MSLHFSGSFSRSAGVISAINKQLKAVKLKPVKKIQVKFDPFHPKAKVAREFLYHITTPNVLETNLNCFIKPIVVCDRSEPEIQIDLIDKGSIKFLADNLSVLEILQQINIHISSKVEPEEVINTPVAKLVSKKQRKK